MAQKAYSLSHTKWMCKYHIVFTPKYRRKIIYNQIRRDIGEILRRLCEYKSVEIIEGHLMPDHVHILVSIPPKISASSFMGYLKGKSSPTVFDKHANLKYKFGDGRFWAEGYYVSTVGLNEAAIAKYIREQEVILSMRNYPSTPTKLTRSRQRPLASGASRLYPVPATSAPPSSPPGRP